MAIITNLMGAIFRRDYPDGNPARAQQYRDWADSVGYSSAGVSITEDTATTLSAVYRSVQLIASTIASFPLHVFEEQDDGSRKVVEYRQDAYLWKRPNPEVSSVVFWETVIGHEVLNGNAFLFVVFDGSRRPVELWPIMPGRVTVQRDESGHKVYLIDGAPGYRDYTQGGEIVHITGWGRDGMVGISPIRQMAQALGLAKAAEDYASRLFSQGSVQRGMLHTDGALTPAQAKELSQVWESQFTGIANQHKTPVIGNGLKWLSMSMNPEDAQMLLSRQFQVSEIARMFGVPETLIGAHDKASSWGTGLEIFNRNFITYTLAPHMIRFEQTISDELLGGDRYVKFNPDALLRGTAKERGEHYEVMARIAAFTINDILALEDRPGIGAAGDVRLVPLNMTTLDNMLAKPMVPAAGGGT